MIPNYLIPSPSMNATENDDKDLFKSYYILQTELLQFSNTPTCLPNFTPKQDLIPEEGINNVENSTKRIPMQDRSQKENSSVAGKIPLKSQNGISKRLLDKNRLKVAKLHIPARAPVTFPPVSQEKTPMSQILDFIYIGNARDSKNMDLLQKAGITHIINASRDIPNTFEENGTIKYLRVPVDDSGSEDLTPYFIRAIEFIDEAVRVNGHVLVHCKEGVSRSTSLVVAYIMAHSSLTLMHALALVSHARSIICPNISFLGQLDKFHEFLHHDFVRYANYDSYDCKTVEQEIARRFRDYQLEASKEDENPTFHLQGLRRKAVDVY